MGNELTVPLSVVMIVETASRASFLLLDDVMEVGREMRRYFVVLDMVQSMAGVGVNDEWTRQDKTGREGGVIGAMLRQIFRGR